MKKLEIEKMYIYLKDKNKEIEILKNINFKLEAGEHIGIVGESGSGKTLFISSILGLLEKNKWKINGTLKTNNLKFALIPQDPKNSFNPLQNIESHFTDTFYKIGSKSMIRKIAIDILKKMYIENPERVLKCYPFQLSGGMLQRIAIAIAILAEPDVLIADEPTTSLDSITQDEIIYLLNTLKKNKKTSIIIISHNFKVIEQIANKVYVMYQGEVIEESSLKNILFAPKHSYTKLLLSSIPRFSKEKIEIIYEDSNKKIKGCNFFYRCPRKKIICKYLKPEYIFIKNHGRVKCRCVE